MTYIKEKRSEMWKDLKVPGLKDVCVHGGAILLASVVAALAVAVMDSAFAALVAVFV